MAALSAEDARALAANLRVPATANMTKRNAVNAAVRVMGFVDDVI